jgi:hypothetical protein
MVEYIRKIFIPYSLLKVVFTHILVNQFSENTKIKPQIL